MHRIATLFSSALLALLLGQGVFASAGDGVQSLPTDLLCAEESARLRAKAQAFTDNPTVEALGEVCAAAGSLLVGLRATCEEEKAAAGAQYPQWALGFQELYGGLYMDLRNKALAGSPYPDAFVGRYVPGMTLERGYSITRELRASGNLSEEDMKMYSHFSFFVRHVGHMHRHLIGSFLEEEVGRQLPLHFQVHKQLFDITSAQPAWEKLKEFTTLEGVDHFFWLSAQDLPFDLIPLLFICGQDEETVHRRFLFSCISNDELKKALQENHFPESLGRTGGNWIQLMNMDKDIFDRSLASLKVHLKECGQESNPRTNEDFESTLASYTHFQCRANEALHAHWQVEQVLLGTLIGEGAKGRGSPTPLYDVLLARWKEDTAATAILDQYKQALHPRTILTMGRIREILDRNHIKDDQETVKGEETPNI
ncbi:MAG: hypothetical protein LCH26_07365 [Proteobacteria bacterium]|nr:hypothetical protein [Pseudomonadota bacterium]